MSSRDVKRRLAAILSADVKGYSRLMREDELATITTLRAYQEAMAAHIRRHEGRVVDFTGDNALAEFPSAVNAVNCAFAIQRELETRNAHLPENRKMQFRIGINIGDIIEDDARIFGNGVNVAARIEGLADPGGICISRQVYDQISNKLPLSFHYLGPHEVKNIEEPVRVYRVLMDREQTKPQDDQAAEPPAVASVAVMPFLNLSGDDEQDVLCEALTEEVITGLSNTPHLVVAAGKSSCGRDDSDFQVQQIAKELRVRYLLQGSIQKSGRRVRISARLVEGESGHQLWADRFDRRVDDIFALQDDIALEIMSALQVKLTHGNHARTYVRGTRNRKAYEMILKGFEHYFKFDRDGNILAKQTARKVIALDPGYPKGHVLLAFAMLRDVMFGWSASPEETIAEAEELAADALKMDRSSATVHALLGNLCLVKHQPRQAIEKLEEALAHNPTSADNVALLGIVLNYAGKYKEAVTMFKKAIFLNPKPADWYYHQVAASYLALGRADRAASAYRHSVRINPDCLLAHAGLAAICGSENREAEARAEASEVFRLDPGFSSATWQKTIPFLDSPGREKLTEGLIKAGIS